MNTKYYGAIQSNEFETLTEEIVSSHESKENYHSEDSIFNSILNVIFMSGLTRTLTSTIIEINYIGWRHITEAKGT